MKNLKIFIALSLIIHIIWAFGQQPSKITPTLIKSFSRQQNHLYLPNKDNFTIKLLTDNKQTSKLIKLCKNKYYPVDTLYIEIPDITKNSEYLASFIKKLQKNNIKTIFLFNDSIQITNKEYFTVRISQIIDYNKNYPETKISGVHFNFEPYLHPAWYEKPKMLIENILDILEETKTTIVQKNISLAIGLSLPYTYNFEQKQEEQYIQQLFNYVNFANIYSLSNDYQQTINNIDSLASYLEDIQTQFNLNIMLRPIPNKTISYHGLNPNSIKKSLKQLKKSLNKFKNFNCFVFDNYYQFSEFIENLNNIKNIDDEQESLTVIELFNKQTRNFTIETNNKEIADCQISHNKDQINLKILVNDKNYIFTEKGIRENLVTDDHIEVLFYSDLRLGSPKRNILIFKASPGNNHYPPYIKLIQPSGVTLSKAWKISSNINKSNYVLEITIPKNELFFDNIDDNFLRFNYKVFDINSTKTRKQTIYQYTEDELTMPLINFKYEKI